MKVFIGYDEREARAWDVAARTLYETSGIVAEPLYADKLAAQGTSFAQFTVASGVCSPSRTAVMTGHYPAQYSIHQHFADPRHNQKCGMPDWPSDERWIRGGSMASNRSG